MNRDELRKRTKAFALRIINLVAALPHGQIGDVLGRQIHESGTSLGANYRETLRASSKRQFASMIEIALREADETVYRLELLADSGTLKPSRLTELIQESNELVVILATTAKTARKSL